MLILTALQHPEFFMCDLTWKHPVSKTRKRVVPQPRTFHGSCWNISSPSYSSATN